MLSTDAHNPKQEKKMTCDEFVNNTRRPCPSISAAYLTHIYERITKEKFETETDYLATIYGRLKDLTVSNFGEAI
jgi:Sec7-like guanine-nucleotide exchange factor